jgi:glycosyltransferase involved in cell wall biosynthesis
MQRILFVIPNLEYSGVARQFLVLLSHLPRHEFNAHVCVLGQEGPWAKSLTESGVPTEFLGWKRLLETKPLLRLREQIRRHQPDVIHAWGRASLWAVAFTAGRSESRLVVSGVQPSRRRGPQLTWLDRWLLRRAAAVTAGHPAAAAAWRRLGLPAARVVLIPPGVAAGPAARGESMPARPPGVPASARLLVGVGPLEPKKGLGDTIWAIDILRFLYDDLYLVLAGDGSDRPKLEQFARIVRMTDRIHFAGRPETVTPLLAAADVVWVPSYAEAGVNVALEAMSLGQPVVATRVPGLADVVVDGETGFLIPPGGKAALARQTRRLLDDPALCRRLGRAGRERVARLFSAEMAAQHYADLYRAAQGESGTFPFGFFRFSRQNKRVPTLAEERRAVR